MAMNGVDLLSNDLIEAIKKPHLVLYSDEFVVIIADKYPKSKHHYLVMPKEDVRTLCDLTEHHIPKLIYMELKGLEYVIRITGLAACDLQVGYHAYPSMNRLHLHVMSKDFCGEHMKLPYQWNSFHTEFFVPTYKVIYELQTKNSVILPPNKKCLQQPLQCNKCDYFCFTIQQLKTHLTLFHIQS